MEDILFYMLKSCGLLCLFFLFYFFLLKKDTAFTTNRKFLLAGLITSAILPAVTFTKTVFIEAQAPAYNYTQGNFPITEVVVEEPSLSPAQIFLGLYLLGVGIMLGRLLLQSISLARVLYNGKRSFSNGSKYIETELRIAPFSFLNFIVYNPNLHSEAELKHILKHEKAHVSQWHTADVLFANLTLVYQWFNPLAWFYVRSIQQNLEFIADKEAVKEVACKKEYQKALVKISVENFNMALTSNFYQSLIKKRIMMLNKPTGKANNTWKAILIMPALCAFLFLFNVETVAQVKEKETEPATEVSTNLEISLNITANSTKEQLESYSRLMDKYEIQLNFEDMEFNSSGMLTSLTASFLNERDNSSGSVTRSNESGIQDLIFFYKENSGAGFRSSPATKAKGGAFSLSALGQEPLYIVKGTTYPASQLEGKNIKIRGDVQAIQPTEAVEKYGPAAKDGALIVTEGTIIDDLKKELKRIDATNVSATNDYVQIRKGDRPTWFNVVKNTETGEKDAPKKTAQAKNESNRVLKIKNVNKGDKDPIYILNGEIVKNPDTIHLLNPNNISSINVLKGGSATSLYGEDAKDGAVIIQTKMDTVASTGTGRKYSRMAIATNPTFSNNRSISISSGNKVNDTIVGDSSSVITIQRNKTYTMNTDGVEINASQYGTRTSPNHQVFIPQEVSEPLYVIDGKEMGKDFDMDEIDPQNIKSINVLKGDLATKEYGEKGENGVIEIKLKEKKK